MYIVKILSFRIIVFMFICHEMNDAHLTVIVLIKHVFIYLLQWKVPGMLKTFFLVVFTNEFQKRWQ